MGAWIEINAKANAQRLAGVAPLVGAWIEIHNKSMERQLQRVAPLVGAWIEIFDIANMNVAEQSLLSWERGLK